MNGSLMVRSRGIVGKRKPKSRRAGNNALKKLLDLGGQTVGAGGGAALGYGIGGPAGAIIGGASGQLLASMSSVALDMVQRSLSDRERRRVGVVLLYAERRLSERLEEGDEIRSDDFFERGGGVGNRSSLDEAIEGVLLAAERDPEEKKLPLYGNLFATIALNGDLDVATANQLIRLSRDLSYRQLCLIALFALRDKDRLELRTRNYKPTKETTSSTVPLGEPLIGVLQEIHILCSQEMLAGGGLSLTDIVPSSVQTQGIGSLLFESTELNTLPSSEIGQSGQLLAESYSLPGWDEFGL
jgi:hypothetical protein